MGLFDVFKAGNKPTESQAKKSVPSFSKEKCSKCSKQFGTQKIYYTYPGKKKGGLQITGEVLMCEECMGKEYDLSDVKPDVNKNVAIIMALQGKDQTKLKEALNLLDKDQDKDNPSYWYSRANILSNMKDMKNALKDYDRALFLDTHYIKAWYRKGWVLTYNKEYKDASKCYENVLALEVWLNEVSEEYVQKALNGEKPDLNEFVNAVVANTKNGKSKGWSQAALITQVYTLMLYANSKAQKGPKITPKEANEIKNKLLFSYLVLRAYPNISGKLPNVTSPDFIRLNMPDFILPNIMGILNVVEPNVVAQFSVGWEKH